MKSNPFSITIPFTFAFVLAFVGMSATLYSQSKKEMDESVYSTWNRIIGSKISNDGNHLLYHLSPESKDQTGIIYSVKESDSRIIERAEGGSFDFESKYAFFRIVSRKDSLRERKRRDRKRKSHAKDSLAIVQLSTNSTEYIPNLKSYKVPAKWGGYISYQLEPDTSNNASDLTSKDEDEKDKHKSSDLIIRNLNNNVEDTIPNVVSYTLSDESAFILLHSKLRGSQGPSEVYLYDCIKMEKLQLLETEKKCTNLAISDDASQAAFIVEKSAAKGHKKTHALYHWNREETAAKLLLDDTSPFLKDDWQVSPDRSISWSKDGMKMHFGVREPLLQRDTTLLEEEIVNVEVWNYQDGRVYTQQKILEEREKKRSYSVIYHTERDSFVKVGTKDYPEARFAPDIEGEFALAYNENPYLKYITWIGSAYKDVYKINMNSGHSSLIAKKIRGNIQISPQGRYFFWYSPLDSAWMTYDLQRKRLNSIADNTMGIFYDESNDIPTEAGSNGFAGWTEGDEFILLYDRFDIWKIDPGALATPQRLTKGREDMIRYRAINLDRDKEYFDLDEDLLLHLFDEHDKSEGYAWLRGSQVDEVMKEDFRFSRRVVKSKDSDVLFYTKESFEQFPDIVLSDLSFETNEKISDANPFQSEYKWGTAELYKWIDFDGNQLEGVLVKPEDFSPEKKYPMLVNFYEQSSHNLHSHRTPLAHRSTINYSFYANRGYIIFNPNVSYEMGYPGESSYNSVVSGVSALINEGFIDKDRIGVQGHSWGGYQIAHLLTRTDLFRCAESGAPVVNMISAYGGIRWGSGLSRMFQYERTQSRIGGTLWEKPELYIENSPIFNMNLHNTPVLIMHNDHDTAVPWYQGIEYFMALRRLGKPAWMLNYNDEPHWPLKWQNRLDFNIRMQQFFDHYLKDAPMPMWMKKGIPAIEKGINSGYELEKGHK